MDMTEIGTEVMVVSDTDHLPAAGKSPENVEILEDIEEARQTYKDLVKEGKKGLDIAFDILENSEHPRAVEVFSGMMKSIAEVTAKMIELQETKKSMITEVSTEPQPGVTHQQNNIFLGSTSDVLKLIHGE